MRMIVVAGLAFAFGWLWGAAWLLDKLDAARKALQQAEKDVKRLQQPTLMTFPAPVYAGTKVLVQRTGDEVRIERANFCPVEK